MRNDFNEVTKSEVFTQKIFVKTKNICRKVKNHYKNLIIVNCQHYYWQSKHTRTEYLHKESQQLLRTKQ